MTRAELKVLWIGHAGILVSNGSTTVAVDPFLVGEFQWNGRIERYLGQSPWIGAGEKARSFVDKFGPGIHAVCITHNHGDHFDAWAIVAIKEQNPDLLVLAPRAIISWLYKSSALAAGDKSNLIEIRASRPYMVNPQESPLVVEAIRDPKSRFSMLPHRVGYLIRPPDAPGVAHLGDSHGIGPGWGKIQRRAIGVVTWDRLAPERVVSFFNVDGTLRHVWPIHWEPFTPGNFDCGKAPHQYIDACKKAGVPASVLSYTDWQITE
jgi:L-ascorbate metabolism protein UlaG (beta-lactamase superfamily)